MVICRDGEKHEFKFVEGYLKSQKVIGKTKETGTDIEFHPSEDVLGKIDLPHTAVLELAEVMAHLSRVKIKVHITPLGKDGDINKIFKSNGIVDALINLAGRKNMLIDPIYFRKEIEDKRVEVAMTYVSNSTEENVLSYANYCTTVDHGTHVSGVKTGLTRVFTKYIKDNLLNAKEKEKLQISGDDCRSGWVCVVNADHLVPSFVGQVKEKLNNEDLVPFCANVTADALKAWIENNPKDSKRIGTMIKKMAKIRQEGQKARSIVTAKSADIFSIDEKKYARATQKATELYILEGDSCMGSAKLARYKEFQELFTIKGVPANSYNYTELDLKKNAEFEMLRLILDCGVGAKCDANKCKYDKIIIGTDADADGYRITSLLSVYFLIHMTDLVKAGKIYKLLPPLYALTGGKKTKDGSEYIDSKRDLNKLIQSEVSVNNTIKDSKGKVLKPNDIIDLLNYNKDYVRELTRLSNKVSVDATLLEFIVRYRELTPKALATKINKAFKELNAKETKGKIVVEGIHNREFQYAIIDEKLFKKAKEVSKLVDLNENKLYGIDFKLNDSKVTLFEMLDNLSQYQPKTIRFKG